MILIIYALWDTEYVISLGLVNLLLPVRVAGLSVTNYINVSTSYKTTLSFAKSNMKSNVTIYFVFIPPLSFSSIVK